MMIRVRNIPEEGLDVEFSIPVKLVRSSFPKGDNTQDIFEKDVACSVRLSSNKKDVYLSGDAKTLVHPTCARCGEEFEVPYQIAMQLTCSPAEKGEEKNSYETSDEGLVFYNHEELDLSEIVREQLLLSLPIQQICQPNCLGLCPDCGANLNLGDHECVNQATKH